MAIGFAIAVFKVGPALIADTLPISNGSVFVLVEGLIRVTVFIIYLALLSFIPNLKRVWMYHAAEHKAINAYEAGDELTPENAQRHSLIHPRCGTTFLFWVMLVGVFVYAPFGRLPWQWLIVTRVAAAAPDLRHLLRADPVRRPPRRQQAADDAARAGPRAAAADDAGADPRPARGVDSRAARSAGT